MTATWQRIRSDAWRLRVRGVTVLLQEDEDAWLVTCEPVGLKECGMACGACSLEEAQRYALRLVGAGLEVVAAEMRKVVECG